MRIQNKKACIYEEIFSLFSFPCKVFWKINIITSKIGASPLIIANIMTNYIFPH